MPPEIFLASQSPRRRELLDQIGVAHRLLTVELDETPIPGESAQGYVIRLAIAKAETGVRMQPPGSDLPVLAADTAVLVEGEILGKPADRGEALAMLAKLSGRSHQVLTGIALAGANCESRLSRSRVTFRPVGPDEAAAYWESGEPRDKAGGYAIQGRGAVFVSRLEGSFSGVMGLPLFETAELLRRAGIEIFHTDSRTMTR